MNFFSGETQLLRSLNEQENFEITIFESLSKDFEQLANLIADINNSKIVRSGICIGKIFSRQISRSACQKGSENTVPLYNAEKAVGQLVKFLLDNKDCFSPSESADTLSSAEQVQQEIKELEQRADRRKDFWEKLSSSLYELSCEVINNNTNRTLKCGILLRNFIKHPLSVPYTCLFRKLTGKPALLRPLIEVEELIYKIHLNIEACRQNNKKEEQKLIMRLREGNYRGVWIIGSLDMGWYETFKQRHHHLAENLMKRGYLVFCAMNPVFPRDITDYIRHENENLYLVNFNDPQKRKSILDILINNSVRPVYYSLMPTEPGTTIDDLRFLQSAGVTIYYDYFDELCKDIYPQVTPQHFERHEFLLKNPDVLVCSTAENLYKKAAKYRSGRVILSKNGVCLEDWETSSESPVPPEMQPVLERNGKIIGF